MESLPSKRLQKLSKAYVEKQLQAHAFNSSHCVWLLTELQYFESTSGALFAYTTTDALLLIVLEPLETNGPLDSQALRTAIEELKQHTGRRRTVFIGIYSEFMKRLSVFGFEGIRIGSDPWVCLADGGPKGNKAKGIRSARNHAVRVGVQVEEWKLSEVVRNHGLRRQVRHVHDLWSESSIFQVTGLLLTSDPFMELVGRRLFVARQGTEVVAILVVSPVRLQQSYYFEDLMYVPTAPNGCTELLILKAMDVLRAEGAAEISLGVVALNSLAFFDEAQVSFVSRITLSVAKRVAQVFYCSKGIELYRKRFQPQRWDPTFVAVQIENARPNLGTWTLVMASTISLLEPHFRLTSRQAVFMLQRGFKRYFVDVLWCFIVLDECVRTKYSLPLTFLCVGLAWLNLNALRAHFRNAYLYSSLIAAAVLLESVHLYVLIKNPSLHWLQAEFEHASLSGFWLPLFLVGMASTKMTRLREFVIFPITFAIWLTLEFSMGSIVSVKDGLGPAIFLTCGFVASQICERIYRKRSASHSKDPSPAENYK